MGKNAKVEIVAKRRALVVRPGELLGSPDRVDVYVCTRCGSVVFDPIHHDSWHRAEAVDGGGRRG